MLAYPRNITTKFKAGFGIIAQSGACIEVYLRLGLSQSAQRAPERQQVKPMNSPDQLRFKCP